jgi:outer membrane protein assembly factor BamB
MNRKLPPSITPLLLGALCALCGSSTPAADWPQFRGPARDGQSPETGLLKKWPEGGPRLERTISGVGEGYSSPSIAAGKIYLSGKVGADLKLFCFDLFGNKLWEQTHGPAFREEDAPHSPYPGARAAPTVDGNAVYLLGCLGKLTAYRASDGEPVWSVDLVADLGGRVPPWGYSEGVLIDSEQLICTPGSEEKGTFAALDKKTGRLLWQSRDTRERAEYASPILIEHEGVRQLINMTRGGLVAVSPDDGSLLWHYNRNAGQPTPERTTAHCNSPVFAEGLVYEAASYQTRGGATVALKKTTAGIEVEPVWQSNKLNPEHGGYVVVDGHIYTSQGPGWTCIELKTGTERWSDRGPGRGAIIHAEGLLYCLGENGRMALIEATPSAFKPVSQFDLPKAEDKCWTHPVISHGKLYLRWDGNLHVYDIRE